MYVARRLDRGAAPLDYMDWRRAATDDDGDDRIMPVRLRARARSGA